MKKILFQLAMSLMCALIFLNISYSQSVESEISGQENNRPFIQNSQRTMDGIPSGGLLLIPESTNERVMAFNPITGNLIDANFIPSDPVNLYTPIEIILNHDATGFLLVDQVNDAVFEYDLQGNFVGLFAPAGGVNTSIIDNPRGICLRPNGNLLVTLGATTNSGACVEFDIDGNYLGIFLPATGTSSFDVIRTSYDYYLVSDIHMDALYGYNSAGSFQGPFSFVNTFPEQIYQCLSGNFLVGNYTGTEEGVLEYNPVGMKIGQYNPAGLGQFRGVYELPNGNILTTTNTGVHEIDRSGNLVDTKISGISGRFISFIPPVTSIIPFSPYIIPLIIIGLLIFSFIRFRRFYGG